jgi:hypothetical protein
MPEGITGYAILRGHPRPLVEGPLFEAQLAYVGSHGQTSPVIVDRGGLVWAGQTMANICFALGVDPVLQVVEDGRAAAIQELATRDLTVLEWADLVTAIYDQASTNFVLSPGEKTAAAVSTWMRNALGRTRGFSQSQVEQYVRISKLPAHQRALVVDAPSLAAAIRRLRASVAAQEIPDASAVGPAQPAERAAIETASAFMAAAVEVSRWSDEGLDLLRGLHRTLGRLLKSQRRRR